MTLRKLGLAILFGLGMITGLVVAVVIYFLGKRSRVRAFHPYGTLCRATVESDELGLAGPALVRLAGAAGEEDSATHTVIGFAIKLAGAQDLPLASFESFLQVKTATANTDITDYLANTFASVTPWKVPGDGIVWFRAHRVLPAGTTGSTKPTRSERLRDDIASGRAKVELSIHARPNADGPRIRKLATITLTEIIPADPTFRISMFHTGRHLVPTGFRNGIRAVVYPSGQRGRG
ncbi:MAG: hypothetical protein ABI678_18135 [Kofleriaceae bacterium]